MSLKGAGPGSSEDDRETRHQGPAPPFTLEHAQQIAGHTSPKTTKLYDRPADTVTVDEIKRLPNRWICSATPCGPLASTTRSTSTTTSPPASATTGRDSTAARGQTPAAARRRGCRARRHRRPRGRPPTAAATGLATTDHCGRTSEDLGDGVPLPNGGRVNTLRHQPNRRASRTDYEAAVHGVAGEEHDQHAHFPPRSRASEIRRPLNQIPRSP